VTHVTAKYYLSGFGGSLLWSMLISESVPPYEQYCPEFNLFLTANRKAIFVQNEEILNRESGG